MLAAAMFSITGCSRPQPAVSTGPPPLYAHGPPSSYYRGSPLSTVIKLPEGKPVRVFFIGNSLTGAHELPRVVQAMAASVGVRLEFNACMRGGANLEDHWNDRRCRSILQEEPWDYVVLQQGPSTIPDSQADLKKWTAKWAAEARNRGAKPGLYMVWAPRGQTNGMALASKSYRDAAKGSGCILLPAGDAWARAQKFTSEIELYERDGLHPRLTGTYLASLVITRGIIGEKANKIPDRLEVATGEYIDIPPTVCSRLQRLAEVTMQAESAARMSNDR